MYRYVKRSSDLEEQAKEPAAVQALLVERRPVARVKSDESLPPEDVIYGMKCIYTFHSKDYMFIAIGFPFINPLL